MATTYLGYVEGGKCRDTNAVPDRRKDNKGVIRNHYPMTHKQFWVIDELAKLDIDAWCGRKIDFYRTGNNRYAEAHESPFLPNYLFMEMTPDQFIAALNVKHLSSSFMAVPQAEVSAGLAKFKAGVNAEHEKGLKIDANSKAAIAEYREGQEIAALSGPFAEMTLFFRRLVQSGNDPWPRIEAMTDMMGRMVPVQLDPLDVKAAQ